jgi:hypothetical protein
MSTTGSASRSQPQKGHRNCHQQNERFHAYFPISLPPMVTGDSEIELPDIDSRSPNQCNRTYYSSPVNRLLSDWLRYGRPSFDQGR